MIRVMIVDDEPLAREELERLIKGDNEFEIVDHAANGNDALQNLKKKQIDVVFLDIDMPGLSGLEVAGRLAEWPKPPRVVFATAYDQYAIEAFEANAIDYILKPYDAGRLKKTLERVKELFQSQAPARDNLISLEDELIKKGVLKKLIGHKKKTKDRLVVDPKDVYYFNVRYSEIYACLESDELIVHATLKELLDNLDSAQFAQTHKSFIVNLDKVQKVSPMFSGNYEITLKHSGMPKIPLSRRYAKGLKGRVGGW
ncbi:MAG: LytTR family DNA-binding domain-containing protein [Candidatus Omnitrophica bacterium]|nr:LytTR family DNA-binding domain-containing protein [Candidatus Omnitrophota bacterium]MDD5670725.1 LytTR family DNA-binding domain-containing protein [Candidatus Omnitrophota bacterium]